MVIDMNEKKLVALDQLREFLAATSEVEFQGCGQDEERYRHIEAVLKRFGYGRLGRADKGWCCATWSERRATPDSN
jgi:hypothetical protein